MGLRQVKAERTRAAILDAALDLFSEQGFDPTTMDQVAARAEVGIATLYRYFPTKDGILLEPLVRAQGMLAELLDARPADEPIDEALGYALDGYLAAYDRDAESRLRLRDLLDAAPGPRARLWDLWAQERALLEAAIARRTSASPDDLSVGIASHTVMMILEMALDLHRAGNPPCTAEQAARDIIGLLSTDGAPIPRLPLDQHEDRFPATQE